MHFVVSINRVFYALFGFFAVYHLWRQDAVMDAAAALGIALVFDPFNGVKQSGQTETPWSLRPMWQRVWLLVHLIVLFGLFAYGWAGR